MQERSDRIGGRRDHVNRRPGPLAVEIRPCVEQAAVQRRQIGPTDPVAAVVRAAKDPPVAAPCEHFDGGQIGRHDTRPADESRGRAARAASGSGGTRSRAAERPAGGATGSGRRAARCYTSAAGGAAAGRRAARAGTARTGGRPAGPAAAVGSQHRAATRAGQAHGDGCRQRDESSGRRSAHGGSGYIKQRQHLASPQSTAPFLSAVSRRERKRAPG